MDAWRLVMAVLALLLAAGCGSDAADGAAGGRTDVPRVVTTVSPITSLAAAVAGEHAIVTGVVPEGENSHTFAPKPSMARLLSDADVVFVNGLGLEEPVIRMARATAREVPIVELAAEAIDRSEWIFDESFPESAGHPNPHLWTSPQLGRRYAESIRDTLVAAQPRHATVYRANFDRLAVRLDQLDRAVRDATATVAPDRRKLLTYHDSFPYFARDYGWSVIGAIQPADFTNPSPRDVARLIEQIRTERVPAVFGSEVFPSPVLAQIGRETGVRYVDTLRDDDLPGSPGDPAHSYVGLLVTDFVTMVDALGGDASALRAVDTHPTVRDRARYPQ